jgi:hypothetical protein
MKKCAPIIKKKNITALWSLKMMTMWKMIQASQMKMREKSYVLQTTLLGSETQTSLIIKMKNS